MHVSDGVLTPAITIITYSGAIIATAIGLKQINQDKIHQVGILASFFFVASLIFVPIGPSSVHLLMNGLLGIVLGWSLFPGLILALLLQSIMFGFGGISALGANVINVGVPALLCFYIFRPMIQKDKGPKEIFIIGALSGFMGVALTGIMLAFTLYLSGEEFSHLAKTIFIGHIPVMIVEAIVTGFALGLVYKVRPQELIQDVGQLAN